jgi:hypothetical protein
MNHCKGANWNFDGRGPIRNAVQLDGDGEDTSIAERRTAASAPSASNSNMVSNAAADEFLYQDARDREERYRQREREQQAEIEAIAAAKKINSNSMTLLRRKAVSERYNSNTIFLTVLLRKLLVL